MSKQDRQGVRTAAELERKYNLGAFGEKNQEQSAEISRLSQTLSQFIATTNAKMSELEDKFTSPFHVGSVYISLDSTNPNELLGGEWELLATGHLLVGLEPEGEEPLPEILQSDDTCYLWKRTA